MLTFKQFVEREEVWNKFFQRDQDMHTEFPSDEEVPDDFSVIHGPNDYADAPYPDPNWKANKNPVSPQIAPPIKLSKSRVKRLDRYRQILKNEPTQPYS